MGVEDLAFAVERFTTLMNCYGKKKVFWIYMITE